MGRRKERVLASRNRSGRLTGVIRVNLLQHYDLGKNVTCRVTMARQGLGCLRLQWRQPKMTSQSHILSAVFVGLGFNARGLN